MSEIQNKVQTHITFQSSANDFGSFPERFLNEFGRLPVSSAHCRFPVDISKLDTLEGVSLKSKVRYVEEEYVRYGHQTGGQMCLTGADTLIGVHFMRHSADKWVAECSVHCLDDEQCEAWVKKLWQIRAKIRRSPRPHIRLMTISPGGGMTLTDCHLRAHSIDIAKHYNDDIEPTITAIRSALADRNSTGLVLLDGLPGTGKTNLVKWLTAKYQKRTFIFIPSGMVESLSGPQLIDLLLSNPGSVLFIEDAERALVDRKHSGQSAVVSTLLQLTDGILGDALRLMVIATCNADISHIDQALLRPGRLIAQYTFNKLSSAKADAIRQELDEPASGEEATLADLYANQAVIGGKKQTKQIGFAVGQKTVTVIKRADIESGRIGMVTRRP